ncbi:HNH endonuclease [Bradyrhizobium diazoefficiens]|uniref:HNH endonuclease signature motif containing protein n=1 Tax=Bradyrhizobium TaxID=374 RepID=UPI00103F277C|nr:MULTISPECIES: HNH endonuclease signature motif containing protein [Bradyrhizobium]MCD9295378.1 HNH endonuclease [Bradyrhizobium diazoefficiens]MCD9809814.1 HNH endonuclease [Bradyrhizobium diazoefficiens]MCD9827241.1 HNH endonuclease [Bradyrhizobium diazoefficiens]MCD9844800.1 HNH endonuclease [Bradyrhizobium diazoefficiens]MCD9881177.1 HNH endonuclease [Bradyrhizobium diazoefficiens]
MSRIDGQEPGMRKGPDTSLNRSDLALMARGISNTKAVKLRAAGYTLGKLQQMNRAALRKVGIDTLAIDNILGDGRPAIPSDKLIEVLFANRFTCCVCRNHKRGVVVHHIRKWAKTRDHEVPNLAVLCTLDHEKVHTKSELTKNLDPKTLRGIKKKWEGEVAEMDTEAILDQSRQHTSAWQYFNHLRLFELATEQRIKFKQLNGYETAWRLDMCDEAGLLLPRPKDTGYMYDGGDGQALYTYVRSVLHASLEKLTVANISNDLERGALSALLSVGDFILVQGSHTFSPRGLSHRRPGQTTDGVRKANQVIVEFTFDRWEATSNSAHGRWLSGRVDVTTIIRVSTISRTTSGKMRIQGTVFAVALGFSGFKTREYSTYPYRYGVRAISEDDEEDDED